MSYSAYVLSEAGRASLLKAFSPKHPEVIAHHVTYAFPDTSPPPELSAVRVVGHASNDKIECVVVEVDGRVERPKGGLFHITLSLNRALGAKPVHSNNLIKEGWTALKEPFELEVRAELVTHQAPPKASPKAKREKKGKGKAEAEASALTEQRRADNSSKETAPKAPKAPKKAKERSPRSAP